MQTIYLDISNKGVIPTIYAKQGDVGRKFEVVLTDSGLPYIPVGDSSFSVWYSGESGDGNYTEIGGRSAFSVNGNKVTVEMIAQMLSNDGDGILSIVLNDISGNQIGLWNVPYICEAVPGSDSEGAKDYYTAFSKSVEELSNTEEILKNKLSVDGSNSMTADLPMDGHKVTGLSEPISNGDAINLGFANENYRAYNWLPTIAEIGAAPAGYGLGKISNENTITSISDLDALKVNCNFLYSSPENPIIVGSVSIIYAYGRVDAYDGSRAKMAIVPVFPEYKSTIVRYAGSGGTWGEWDWVNPPMDVGVEYRTTERWQGKPVFTKLFDFGEAANDKVMRFTSDTVTPVRNGGVVGACITPYIYGNELGNGYTTHFIVNGNTARLYCGAQHTGKQSYLQVWYVKN